MLSNWIESLSNPQGKLVKKFLFGLLQDRYEKHAEIIDRLSRSLVTKGDIEAFGNLAMELYETGYFKSIGDHKDALAKMGVKVQIKAQEPPPKTEKIFKDQ